MTKDGAVFFDLDGTLVDTSIDILSSLRFAAESCGFVGTEFSLSLIGRPVREIFSLTIPGLSKKGLDTLQGAFRSHHDSVPLLSWRAYDGVKETLELLSGLNIPYYVVTNRPRTGVQNLVKSGFTHIPLEFYFCVGEHNCSDKSSLFRLLLERTGLDGKSCLAFGDQEGDVIAAQQNGVSACFCNFGFGVLSENRLKSVNKVTSHIEIQGKLRLRFD